MMAQMICQPQRKGDGEGTEWYNLYGSVTKLCHPKVVFQLPMMQQVRYQYQLFSSY